MKKRGKGLLALLLAALAAWAVYKRLPTEEAEADRFADEPR